MQMLTTAAAAAKIGLSASTLRGIVQRGQFVTPVQVAPRRIAYVEAEVDTWLANRPRGKLPAPQTSCTRRQRAPTQSPGATPQPT